MPSWFDFVIAPVQFVLEPIQIVLSTAANNKGAEQTAVATKAQADLHLCCSLKAKIEDLTRVVISYEIYETSLWRVS